MRFDSVLFDLDGTLWDTTATCAEAWNRVLVRTGIDHRSMSADDVRRFTGLPHEKLIRSAFAGLGEASLRVLIEEIMVEENAVLAEVGGVLYPGVEEGLVELSERYPLFIVSNCQSGYIEPFLDVHRVRPLFQDWECWGNTLQTKEENLRRVIERNRLTFPVMVGDTDSDRSAAQANRVPFVFVEYGFQSHCEADFRFATFKDLVQSLMNSS